MESGDTIRNNTKVRMEIIVEYGACYGCITGKLSLTSSKLKGSGSVIQLHPSSYYKALKARKAGRGVRLDITRHEVKKGYKKAQGGSIWSKVWGGIKSAFKFAKDTGVLNKLADAAVGPASAYTGNPGAVMAARQGLKSLTGIGVYDSDSDVEKEGGRVTMDEVKRGEKRALSYAQRKGILTDVVDFGEKYLLSKATKPEPQGQSVRFPSLKGYLGYGNQSTISTVGVLTEVAIGSTGVYNTQEYLLINGNGSNYLDGSYTRMCSFYGSNVTPAWFRIEVSNGSKTVSTSATWIGNNSDTDRRFGTNNSTYGICLGGTNRGRWGFGTTSPAYGLHNALRVSTIIDPVRSSKDFRKLYDYVADAMSKVEPLLFRYKSDDDTIPLQLGNKAQDLIRAGLVHCINFAPNEDMHVEDPEVDTESIQYSVDYSKMFCLLHKLVHKQQREIDEMKSRISDLL
ncbi:unnamed protein product [Phytophthora fragariaefolia]|uniref:Unnamed protein product n=1 Tax=Phytophthora fragariaefolia TaxID=1490495 RepID=A0A9W6Y4F6_9STRA|nr:unnamed protein product [Phytophthora fragariaefolia]